MAIDYRAEHILLHANSNLCNSLNLTAALHVNLPVLDS